MFFFPGHIPTPDPLVKIIKGKVACPLCQKIFLARRSLLRHLRVVHNRQDYREIVPSSRIGKEAERPRNKRGRFVRPGEESGDDDDNFSEDSISRGDQGEYPYALSGAAEKISVPEASSAYVGGAGCDTDMSAASASAPAKDKGATAASTAAKIKRKSRASTTQSSAMQSVQMVFQMPNMDMQGMTSWGEMPIGAIQPMIQTFRGAPIQNSGFNQKGVMQPIVIGSPVLLQMQGATAAQDPPQMNPQMPNQWGAIIPMQLADQMQMAGQVHMGGQIPMQLAAQMPMQMTWQMPIHMSPQISHRMSHQFHRQGTIQLPYQFQRQGAAQVQAMGTTQLPYSGAVQQGGQATQMRMIWLRE